MLNKITELQFNYEPARNGAPEQFLTAKVGQDKCIGILEHAEGYDVHYAHGGVVRVHNPYLAISKAV